MSHRIDIILALIDDALEETPKTEPRFPAMLTNGNTVRRAWSEQNSNRQTRKGVNK